MNFDEALEKSPVPVIGHETGQFQTYPNYEEEIYRSLSSLEF